MTKYYQPSGEYTLKSLIGLLVCCLTIVPILGFLYSYAIFYIPFVYLNMLLTGAIGVLLAFAVQLIVISWGQVRNTSLALALAVVAGVFALYVHWVSWLGLIINSTESTTSLVSLFMQPDVVFELVGKINQYGTWGIRGSTVSGFFLTLVWIVEGATIIGIPAYMAYMASGKPFCEISKKWAEDIELPAFEYLKDPELVKSELEKGNFEIFDSLKKADPSYQSHSKFTLYHCEGTDTYYLSIENCLAKRNDKDKLEFDNMDLVQFLLIGSAAGKNLLRGHKAMAA